MQQHIDVRVSVPASPAAVYALLRDGASWPTWSPIGSFQLERPADDEPEGPGAIRAFRTGRHITRERVAELLPDKRFSYELVSGLAIRDYRADIDLTPTPDGTDLHWHSTFRATMPGTGWLYQRALRRFIQRCATGLASHLSFGT